MLNNFFKAVAEIWKLQWKSYKGTGLLWITPVYFGYTRFIIKEESQKINPFESGGLSRLKLLFKFIVSRVYFIFIMILQTWGDVIIVYLQQVWTSLAAFVPSFIGAVLVFLIGWVVAEAVGSIVHQVVRALRLDGLLHKLDLGRIAERAGWKLDSGAFAGWIVKWSLVVAFLLASVSILGLTAVSDFLKDVLLYIPNVVIAALVLVIAAIVADVVERAVRGSVEAAGYRGSLSALF